MTEVLARPARTEAGRAAIAPSTALEHLAGLGFPLLALTYLAHATGGRLQPQLGVTVGAAALSCLILRVWRVPVGWLVGAGALAAAGLLVAVLHVPGPRDPIGTFYRWSAADGYVLAAALTVTVRRYATGAGRRRALLLAVIAAGALQFGWAFTPWWGGGHPSAQMVGTFYWHNQYAAFLLAPAVLGFAVALESRRPWRFLGWVGAVLGTAGVFYSTSRATLAVLIACFAVVGAWALWQVPSPRVTAARITGLVLAAGLLVLAMSNPPLVTSSRSPLAGEHQRTAGQSLSRNGNYRVDFWREALVVAVRHPVDGAGYGELDRAALGHVPADYPVSPLAHEGLLQAFADGGLLLGVPVLGGVGALVVLAVRPVGSFLRRRRNDDGTGEDGPHEDRNTGLVDAAVIVAFAGLLVHSLVDFDWSYPALLCMGAVVATLAATTPSVIASRTADAR